MKLRYTIDIPLSNDEHTVAHLMVLKVHMFQDMMRSIDPFFGEAVVTAELIDDKASEEAACPSSTVPLPVIKDSPSAPPMG